VVCIKETGTFAGASFFLPLNDLGSGVVNVVPLTGTGAATFTRATTAAARLSTGLWNLNVAANVARAHYLQDLTYAGYWPESAATQLLTSPRDMTNAAWVKVNMTAAQTSVGLDGAANSCTRLTATAANGTALQTLVAAASARTYSAYIRRATGTGTIAICQDGVTFTDVTAQVTAGTLGLVQLTASQLNAVFGIRLGTSGDAIDVDCNQFEAGTFATTPIPAAGTRAADLETFPQAGNVDNTKGTAYAEVCVEWANGGVQNYSYLTLGAGVAGSFWMNNATAPTTGGAYDGTNVLNKAGLSNLFNAVGKRAVSWGAAGMSSTGDGLAPATSAFDGIFGTAAGTVIAVASGLNGGIKNVAIWPTQLPDATLQTITT
jgi:hypothetical protein